MGEERLSRKISSLGARRGLYLKGVDGDAYILRSRSDDYIVAFLGAFFHYSSAKETAKRVLARIGTLEEASS